MEPAASAQRFRKIQFVAASLFALVGCQQVIHPPPPLNPQSFIAPADRSAPSPAATQPAAPSVAIDVKPTEPPAALATARAQVSSTAPDATSQPATTETLVPTGATLGVDQVVGTVLADVDSDPIYADKVLAALDNVLAADAKQYDEEHFRQVAADLIHKQVGEFVRADVYFAAAKRNLESKDEQLAHQATIEWRKQQITQAGGSVELAERRAIDQGTTLAEMCQEHYRLVMTELYFQRKLYPQIQISAADVRSYYDQHRDSDYTTPALAKFRVIRIDSDKTGGDDAAKAKIEHIRDRIQGGAAFDVVAGETNDDPILLSNKGDPRPGSWMSRGSYVNSDVDAAVWKLDPGQMTDIIHSGDSYYLAKLDARQGGEVKAFADQEIQDQITETLRRQQFNALRDQLTDDLERKAVIHENPGMQEVALEMVMQKYAAWAGKSEKSTVPSRPK